MKNLNYSIGNACNLRCGFCYNDLERNSKTYFKDIKKIEKELIIFKKTNHGLILIGGEPTFHPKFIEILKLIKKSGYKDITLITNGVKFKNKTFVNDVLNLNILNGIVFSIHSNSNKLEDNITGRNNVFTQKELGLKNIIEYKKSNKAKIMLGINTVVNINNVGILADFSNYFFELGVDNIRFYSMLLKNKNSEKNIKNIVKYNDITESINKINSIYGRKISFHWAPLCISKKLNFGIIREISRKYIFNINTKEEKLFDRHAFNKVKLKKCFNCYAYGKFCFGVFKDYIKKYGDIEFDFIEKKDIYEMIKRQ